MLSTEQVKQVGIEEQELKIREIFSLYEGTIEQYDRLVKECRKTIPKRGRTRKESLVGRIKGKGKKKAESFDLQMKEYKDESTGGLRGSAPMEYQKKFKLYERYMYQSVERNGKASAPFHKVDKECYERLIELGWFKSLDTVEKCNARAEEELKNPKKTNKRGKSKMTEEEKAAKKAKKDAEREEKKRLKEEEKAAKRAKKDAEREEKKRLKEEEKAAKKAKRDAAREEKKRLKEEEKAAKKAKKDAEKDAEKELQKKKNEDDLKGTLSEENYLQDDIQQQKNKDFQEKANACQYESDVESSDDEEDDMFASDDEEFKAGTEHLKKMKSMNIE